MSTRRSTRKRKKSQRLVESEEQAALVNKACNDEPLNQPPPEHTKKRKTAKRKARRDVVTEDDVAKAVKNGKIMTPSKRKAILSLVGKWETRSEESYPAAVQAARAVQHDNEAGFPIGNVLAEHTRERGRPTSIFIVRRRSPLRFDNRRVNLFPALHAQLNGADGECSTWLIGCAEGLALTYYIYCTTPSDGVELFQVEPSRRGDSFAADAAVSKEQVGVKSETRRWIEEHCVFVQLLEQMNEVDVASEVEQTSNSESLCVVQLLHEWQQLQASDPYMEGTSVRAAGDEVDSASESESDSDDADGDEIMEVTQAPLEAARREQVGVGGKRSRDDSAPGAAAGPGALLPRAARDGKRSRRIMMPVLAEDVDHADGRVDAKQRVPVHAWAALASDLHMTATGSRETLAATLRGRTRLQPSFLFFTSWFRVLTHVGREANNAECAIEAKLAFLRAGAIVVELPQLEPKPTTVVNAQPLAQEEGQQQEQPLQRLQEQAQVEPEEHARVDTCEDDPLVDPDEQDDFEALADQFVRAKTALLDAKIRRWTAEDNSSSAEAQELQRLMEAAIREYYSDGSAGDRDLRGVLAAIDALHAGEIASGMCTPLDDVPEDDEEDVVDAHGSDGEFEDDVDQDQDGQAHTDQDALFALLQEAHDGEGSSAVAGRSSDSSLPMASSSDDSCSSDDSSDDGSDDSSDSSDDGSDDSSDDSSDDGDVDMVKGPLAVNVVIKPITALQVWKAVQQLAFLFVAYKTRRAWRVRDNTELWRQVGGVLRLDARLLCTSEINSVSAALSTTVPSARAAMEARHADGARWNEGRVWQLAGGAAVQEEVLFFHTVMTWMAEVRAAAAAKLNGKGNERKKQKKSTEQLLRDNQIGAVRVREKRQMQRQCQGARGGFELDLSHALPATVRQRAAHLVELMRTVHNSIKTELCSARGVFDPLALSDVQLPSLHTMVEAAKERVVGEIEPGLCKLLGRTLVNREAERIEQGIRSCMEKRDKEMAAREKANQPENVPITAWSVQFASKATYSFSMTVFRQFAHGRSVPTDVAQLLQHDQWPSQLMSSTGASDARIAGKISVSAAAAPQPAPQPAPEIEPDCEIEPEPEIEPDCEIEPEDSRPTSTSLPLFFGGADEQGKYAAHFERLQRQDVDRSELEELVGTESGGVHTAKQTGRCALSLLRYIVAYAATYLNPTTKPAKNVDCDEDAQLDLDKLFTFAPGAQGALQQPYASKATMKRAAMHFWFTQLYAEQADPQFQCPTLRVRANGDVVFNWSFMRLPYGASRRVDEDQDDAGADGEEHDVEMNVNPVHVSSEHNPPGVGKQVVVDVLDENSMPAFAKMRVVVNGRGEPDAAGQEGGVSVQHSSYGDEAEVEQAEAYYWEAESIRNALSQSRQPSTKQREWLRASAEARRNRAFVEETRLADRQPVHNRSGKATRTGKRRWTRQTAAGSTGNAASAHRGYTLRAEAAVLFAASETGHISYSPATVQQLRQQLGRYDAQLVPDAQNKYWASWLKNFRRRLQKQQRAARRRRRGLVESVHRSLLAPIVATARSHDVQALYVLWGRLDVARMVQRVQRAEWVDSAGNKRSRTSFRKLRKATARVLQMWRFGEFGSKLRAAARAHPKLHIVRAVEWCSSQRCSGCQSRKSQGLRKVFTCEIHACPRFGVDMDRDANSCVNIFALTLLRAKLHATSIQRSLKQKQLSTDASAHELAAKLPDRAPARSASSSASARVAAAAAAAAGAAAEHVLSNGLQ